LVEHGDSSPFWTNFGQFKNILEFSMIYIYRTVRYPGIGGEGMAKEDLVFILKRLLQTDTYLEFLLQLDEADLRTLIACIRERVDKGKQ
jgi:hypothetical protein